MTETTDQATRARTRPRDAAAAGPGRGASGLRARETAPPHPSA
ncbi:hypothetical protein [Streptomyces sp. cg35]